MIWAILAEKNEDKVHVNQDESLTDLQTRCMFLLNISFEFFSWIFSEFDNYSYKLVKRSYPSGEVEGRGAEKYVEFLLLYVFLLLNVYVYLSTCKYNNFNKIKVKQFNCVKFSFSKLAKTFRLRLSLRPVNSLATSIRFSLSVVSLYIKYGKTIETCLHESPLSNSGWPISFV